MPPRPRKSPRGRPVNTPAGTPATPFQMDPVQLQTLMAQGIATALATYEAARNETASGNSGVEGATPQANRNHTRTCTYKDFMACKPRNFYGNEGVVGLTRWLEKTEAVFRISDCPDNCQVKYATCTLMDAALTWWNDHAKSMGNDAAYSMDWGAFRNLMINEYCPRQEIQALEQELWNLTMKGSEVIAYTSRFNDLASLCPGMVNPEYKKTERYIWGLAPPVQGLVTASRPTTFDSAKQLAYQLTEQCVRQGTMNPQTEKITTGGSKRRLQGKARGNTKQQKTRTEPTTVYAATAVIPEQPKRYAGTAPMCGKCNRHHIGECFHCKHCDKLGHTIDFCRILKAAGNCYECNLPGHLKKDCPKLKGQGGRGRAFAINARDARQDLDVETGTFLINAIYASVYLILVLIGNFVSHKFKSLLSHVPCKQNETYTVEVANDQQESTNEVFSNYLLTLEEHL